MFRLCLILFALSPAAVFGATVSAEVQATVRATVLAEVKATVNYPPPDVPEPSTLCLLFIGVLVVSVVAFFRRRRGGGVK